MEINIISRESIHTIDNQDNIVCGQIDAIITFASLRRPFTRLRINPFVTIQTRKTIALICHSLKVESFTHIHFELIRIIKLVI